MTLAGSNFNLDLIFFAFFLLVTLKKAMHFMTEKWYSYASFHAQYGIITQGEKFLKANKLALLILLMHRERFLRGKINKRTGHSLDSLQACCKQGGGQIMPTIVFTTCPSPRFQDLLTALV